MAYNTGVMTRLQSRRLKENSALRNSNTGAKNKKEVFCQPDEENIEVVNTHSYNRHSFPLDHDNDQGRKNNKKAAKTESTAKQRRTLCLRGNNGSERETVFYMEHQLQNTCAAVYMRDKSAKKDNKDEAELETALCFLEEDINLDNFELIDDIDANPDTLTTNIYSQDIMEYLLWMETRYLLKTGFLSDSPDVTSHMRGVLMDWLLQVQDHEGLKDETLHLSVTLIDNFLSVSKVKISALQLVGITCLLIASKFNERFAPEISTLCHLTDNTFVKEEVLRCERIILHTLQFSLARPVSTTFLDRYFQVHDNSPQVQHMARYLLDLSITRLSFASTLPSFKASCALYVSRLLLLDSQAWTPRLVYYTHYRAEDLQELAREFLNLLTKAPDSKLQGARNKYNRENYCYISQFDRVAKQ